MCGEALIDLAPASDAADTFSSTWHALSAGGPMNTAVALGRLGADVHFLGRLSRDSFGAQLRGHIQKSNVALDLTIESSQSTSIAVVSLDAAGVASYTFHFAGTANFDWQPEDLPVLDADDWLHIASLACVVRPGSEVLLDWTQTCGAGMSYDINVRPTVITDPKAYWEEVQPGCGSSASTVVWSRPATQMSHSWPSQKAMTPTGGRARRLGRAVRSADWSPHSGCRGCAGRGHRWPPYGSARLPGEGG